MRKAAKIDTILREFRSLDQIAAIKGLTGRNVIKCVIASDLVEVADPQGIA